MKKTKGIVLARWIILLILLFGVFKLGQMSEMKRTQRAEDEVYYIYQQLTQWGNDYQWGEDDTGYLIHPVGTGNIFYSLDNFYPIQK